MGDTVEVSTIHGKVDMKIPEAIQSGQAIKLKGKGVAHLSHTGNGDHYVVIQVETPKKLNKKQKKLFEELKGLE